MEIRIKKLHPLAKSIKKATTGSAGWDISYFGPKVSLLPGQILLLPTGLAFEMPNNTEAQIRSRSGLTLKGIIVLNSPGTIDSDYRGEIKVILFNATKVTYEIKPEQAIAQVVFTTLPITEIVYIENFSIETQRDCKGFGSTDS